MSVLTDLIYGGSNAVAGLTEGADFSYTALLGVDAAASAATGAGRTLGRIAAQYDEFFFNDPNVQGGTVRHKDFVATPDGQIWLEQEAPQANTWYDTSDGGRRIIYQPAETHPWNHFSTTSTGHAIDFYTEAFSEYSDMLKTISSSKQIWLWKEIFECVALVGFVMLLLAVAELLLALPFFKQAKTDVLPVQPAASGNTKVISLIITVIAVLMPALFFTPLMDEGAGTANVNILMYLGIAAAAVGILPIVKAKGNRNSLVGGIILILSGASLALVAKTPMYQDYAVWTAPGINSIAYWTIACTMISLVVMGLVYALLKSKDLGLSAYGVVLKPMAIVAGICTGLATVVIGYAVLFLMDALFLADFRIWTFAFKTFDANILPAILRYLPTFLAFYLVSSASITINTNTEGLQGIKGYLAAIVLNAGNKVDVLNVYISADGVEYESYENIEITKTSYNDYTLLIPEMTKYIKLDVAGENQVRVAEMTLYFDGEVPHTCEFVGVETLAPTCTVDGVMTYSFGPRKVVLKQEGQEYVFSAALSEKLPEIWTTNGDEQDFLIDGVCFMPSAGADAAHVGDSLVIKSHGWMEEKKLEKMFGYLPDNSRVTDSTEGDKPYYLPIKVLKNRAELDWLLASHMEDPEWPDLRQETFTQFDEAFFEKNSLVMVYYKNGMDGADPAVTAYKFTEEGTCLSTRLTVPSPAAGDTVLTQWLLFSGIHKSDLEEIKVLEAYVDQTIAESNGADGALSFTGKVKQVEGHAVLLEDTNVSQFSNGVWVELGEIELDPKVGEFYAVTYDGIVMPSMPPRIIATTIQLKG